MSDNAPRQPRAFELTSTKPVESDSNEPPKSASKAKPPRKPKAVPADTVIRTLPDEAALADRSSGSGSQMLADELTPPPPEPRSKRVGWSKLFFGALGGLLALGIGLWVDTLISDLFTRQNWLGWLAIGLTGLLVLAGLAIVLREVWGLLRMRKIEHLRASAADAHANDNMKRARHVIDELSALYSNRPDTAHGRAALEKHEDEIIDGRDLLALVERDLMRPLDAKARGLVMGSAKRVSVVTAVSPRALIDIGFVLIENMRLIRGLADLYGGRPGTLGFFRLARNVVAHLAVTGSIAVGEGLLQQVVGHGVAARISSRLGEGVVNGLLTARIGIAAIDVCRPLPFTDQSRPTVSDFVGELLKSQPDDDKADSSRSGNNS